jgi:hypothetical protein
MLAATPSLISSVGNSMSISFLVATSTKAFLGHSKNQSMEVQLITPGNILALILNKSPSGEKQRHKWRFFLTLSKKNAKSSSGTSLHPAYLASDLILPIRPSSSSLGNSSGIHPDESKSLI